MLGLCKLVGHSGALPADTRVLKDAIRDQNGGGTALGVLNINSAVTADDVLRASEDTRDDKVNNRPNMRLRAPYSVVARFAA